MGELIKSFSSKPTKEADGFNLSQSKFTEKAEEIFKRFQNNELYSDLILVCDDKGGNFRDSVFQVHQILVATRSEYIERAVKMIKQVGMANQGKIILYLDGISKRVMELILEFIYSGNVMIPKSCFKEFMAAAKKLEITGLFKGSNESRKEGSFENWLDKTPEENNNTEEKNWNSKRIKTEECEEMDFALNSFEDTSMNSLNFDGPKDLMEEDFSEEHPKKRKIDSKIKRKQRNLKLSKEVNKLENLQVPEELKVQVHELSQLLQSLAEKLMNKQNRMDQCSECPGLRVQGLTEMKRHVTLHMKSTPGYEHFPKKLKETSKNLRDEEGFCLLCNELQSVHHLKQKHLARKNLEPALMLESAEC